MSVTTSGVIPRRALGRTSSARRLVDRRRQRRLHRALAGGERLERQLGARRRHSGDLRCDHRYDGPLQRRADAHEHVGLFRGRASTDDGVPPPSCNALLGAAEPKIPVDIHIGVEDPLYLYYGANEDAARFEAGGWIPEQNLFWRPFAGGHTYTIAQLGEIWTNICPFALGP